MNDSVIGQYMPGNSILHRIGGLSKLLCMFFLLIAVVLTKTVSGYFLLSAICLALVLLSGIGPKTGLSSISRLGLFFIVIFFMNTVFYKGEQVLWSWGIIHISIEGIMQGMNVILRVILLMILSNILMATTPPMEITQAMETLLSPLGCLRVPTREIAMILSVAIQFIPIFIEETDTIRKAQIARGARFESKKLRERAMSYLPLVVPIFLAAFRRADELSMAMEARGYRRGKGRSKGLKATFQVTDLVALTASCVICAVQIYFH